MTALTKSPMDPLTQAGRVFWRGVLAAGLSTTVPPPEPLPGVADRETPISRQTGVAARRLAYGRAPYTGLGEVVVGFADPVRLGKSVPGDGGPR